MKCSFCDGTQGPFVVRHTERYLLACICGVCVAKCVTTFAEAALRSDLCVPSADVLHQPAAQGSAEPASSDPIPPSSADAQ